MFVLDGYHPPVTRRGHGRTADYRDLPLPRYQAVYMTQQSQQLGPGGLCRWGGNLYIRETIVFSSFSYRAIGDVMADCRGM